MAINYNNVIAVVPITQKERSVHVVVYRSSIILIKEGIKKSINKRIFRKILSLKTAKT